MKNFEHVNAVSLDNAITLLGHNGHSRVIAGGTDLLTTMRIQLISPERLINLKTIPNLSKFSFDEENGLQIQALVTLNTLARDEIIKNKYPLLFQAISSAATPQIRNQGTIGGNLLLASRCWYYRGPFNCWLKGGDICHAKDGENQHHAIFSDGPCYMVHPSDLATALISLGAQIKVAGPRGSRILPLEKLYQLPSEGNRQLVTLQPAEIIESIQIPVPGNDSRGIYLKSMDRKVWAFAMVSVAVQLSLEREVVRQARIVLGGVSPIPYPVPGVETALKGQRLNDESIRRTAEIAISGARPLRHNQYKVPLASELVKQALNSLKSSNST